MTNKPELGSLILPCEGAFYWAFCFKAKGIVIRGYTTYKNVFISSSSRLRYLWSMSHSICSFIIFFCGMNMFLRISTSSVWRAAFVILFLIFMILTIASWKTKPTRLQGSFSLKPLIVCVCRERDSRSTLPFGATTPGYKHVRSPFLGPCQVRKPLPWKWTFRWKTQRLNEFSLF